MDEVLGEEYPACRWVKEEDVAAGEAGLCGSGSVVSRGVLSSGLHVDAFCRAPIGVGCPSLSSARRS